MWRSAKPAGPRRDPLSWRTFLKNQAKAIWTCDFVVQQTVRFTALYIFVVMELGSRKVVHVNVTEHPTQAWVQQQIRDATFEGAPKFIMHDPSTRRSRSSLRAGSNGIYGQLGQVVVHHDRLDVVLRADGLHSIVREMLPKEDADAK